MKSERLAMPSKNSSSFLLIGKYTDITRIEQDGKLRQIHGILSLVAGIYLMRVNHAAMPYMSWSGCGVCPPGFSIAIDEYEIKVQSY